MKGSGGVAIAVAPVNGGFPEPAAGMPVRLVRARHDACGETTLIRVPSELPSRAIRVVVCGTCQESFENEPVSEIGVLAPGPRRRMGPENGAAVKQKPRRGKARREPGLLHPVVPTALGARRTRRLARAANGKPVAAPKTTRKLPALPSPMVMLIGLAGVAGGLLLIQSFSNSDDQQTTTAPAAESSALSPAAAPVTPTTPTPTAPTAGAAGAAAAPTGEAKLIRGSNYTIALPPGWSESTPSNGATFAAAADDGGADATLWVRNDPKLDFPTFEANSMAQLRSLAGSAHIADRLAAPTADGTIVRLAADAPAGKPAYSVTLRVTGPYRYYLATTLEPDASGDAAKGVELLSNSLTPVADGSGQ